MDLLQICKSSILNYFMCCPFYFLRRVRLSVYTKLVTKPVYNVCGKIHGEIEPGIKYLELCYIGTKP